MVAVASSCKLSPKLLDVDGEKAYMFKESSFQSSINGTGDGLDG